MDNLKAPSLPSLLDSDRGSCDSLVESSQFDIEELDDVEYSIPPIDVLPSLESVLSELHCEENDSVLDARGTPSSNSVDLQTFGINENDATHSSHISLGSVLRHVFLQGISSQIQSASERIKAGLASVIAVSDMIAIGTSHGHVLCFDAGQTLRWCCTEYLSHGAVSSLAFNSDCTRLLVGYARGHTVMLNNSTGDTLRSVSECHTPNTAVLSLRWLSSARALCLDSGGSVWSLTFTRHFGVRGCESKCLFSGARGEVCTLEPLILDEDHPLKQYCITAFATMSKIIVVTLKPRLKVVWTQPLAGSTQYLPLLAWQLVVIQASDLSKNRDPVIAYARGTELYFNQIVMSSGRIRCSMLCRVMLSCPLLALHWLGPRSLGCVDSRETLRLMDVRSTTEQETIELGNIGMVYGSAYYKGLATGGNVSPALALAGTHACYNSMASKGSQLLILGHKGVHAVTVRSWSERLSHLTSTCRWSEAFGLIAEGYHAASDRPRRQTMIREKAAQLVQDYLGKTQNTPELALADVFKCCIEIKEESCLLGELWDRLEDSPQTFIELLVPYILDGKLSYVAPYVTQAIVEHYCKHNTKLLQNVILKLDVSCLDLHQVLSICRKHELFSSFIYVTTRALSDYTLPITELIPTLNKFQENCAHRRKVDFIVSSRANNSAESNGDANADDSEETDDVLHGSCAIVDESCGNCSKTRELGDVLLVYVSGCLAGKMFPCGDLNGKDADRVKNEVLSILLATHSSSSLEGELAYPYLRSLLRYDAREALNIINLAFQEPYFNSDLGQAQRMRIINVLMDIIEPDKNNNEAVGCLLHFISQQICYKVIPASSSLLQKVTNYMTSPLSGKMSARQHSERQQVWIDLRGSGVLDHIPISKQIHLARQARCYRVLEDLLEANKSYGEILACYLSDAQRRRQVFHYIEKHSKTPERAVLEQIEENLDQLLSLDSEQTAKSIAEFYPESIDRLCNKVITNSDGVYSFLKSLISYNIKLSQELSELYLELLCQKDKQLVNEYLINCDTFRDDSAIDVMKKYDHKPGLVYLLEKRGDYISAFNILFDMFNKAIASNEDIEQLAHDITNLCCRSSKHLSQSKRESLWFPFLELALSHKELRGNMRTFLHSASAHVRLPDLVQLIVKSEVGGKFGDIKQVLSGMLVNSKYETVLLETTSSILNSDLHHILAKDLFKSRRALSVKICICSLCNKKLCAESVCVVFGCGHCFHAKCKTSSQDVCPVCGFECTVTSELKNYSYPKHDYTDEYVPLNLATPFRPDLEGLF